MDSYYYRFVIFIIIAIKTVIIFLYITMLDILKFDRIYVKDVGNQYPLLQDIIEFIFRFIAGVLLSKILLKIVKCYYC